MKTYSLALGGGAAKGFAHIGVFKYLEEKNIKINEISGTSMGAIIAAFYAIGKSSDEIEKIIGNLKYYRLIDIDLRDGFIKGNKIYTKLMELFGDIKIEDLDINLKIIATNFENGERKVFKNGLLVDALRASMSVPGLMTPHKIKGVTYVDGGLCNNLPIEVLKGDNIIAVSALNNIAKKVEESNKNIGKIFSINYSLFEKSIDIMMKQNEDRSISLKGKNIILVKPKLDLIDGHNFSKYKEIISLGYDAILKKNLF